MLFRSREIHYRFPIAVYSVYNLPGLLSSSFQSVRVFFSLASRLVYLIITCRPYPTHNPPFPAVFVRFDVESISVGLNHTSQRSREHREGLIEVKPRGE